MVGDMSSVSTIGRAYAGAPSPAQAAPDDPAPLAGIACCGELPAREGLGPPLEDELPAGHLLDGRFLIQEAIGRSGMATIYRAEDRTEGGRSVAVQGPPRRGERDRERE